MSSPDEVRIRFSLGRLLLALTLAACWLASFRVLPVEWVLWLLGVVCYAGVAILCTRAPTRTQAEAIVSARPRLSAHSRD